MKAQNFSFDKSYIDTFANGINSSYAINAYTRLINILSNAMNEICAKKPVVTGYECEIVNECLTNSETQNSSLDVFMSIKSPQLELELIKFNKNLLKKFFTRLKLSWKNATYKPKRRNKRKKQQNSIENDKILTKTYTFSSFKNELMINLANYFTDKTMLYINNFGITILCAEDLGMNINLYIGFSNGEKYTLYDEKNIKLIYVEFKDREKNILAKNKSTKGKFVSALRIFNGLYRNIYTKAINQILLESVLYNCPDDLFVEDTNFNMLVKLLNFINCNTMQNFSSITDIQKTISQDNLITQSAILELSDFLKNLAKLI